MRWRIIKQFSLRNMDGFTFQDVIKEFPEKKPVQLARILAGMVEEGMLFKLSRDIYHLIPVNADPKTYLPDGLQMAKYMMQQKAYYLGYGSAMKIHGLSVQSMDREYVVTNKQIKPAIRSFGRISFQFIQHDVSRFFGYSNIWINQYEQAMVSDLEKTIVDMATKPQFCGGIIEVGDAVFRVNERIDHDKVFYYFARNRNKSAKKRFLFLTDLLGLEWTAEHGRMMRELGSGSSLLDPAAPDQGRKRKKFGLKINVDPVDIKKKILNRAMP